MILQVKRSCFRHLKESQSAVGRPPGGSRARPHPTRARLRLRGARGGWGREVGGAGQEPLTQSQAAEWQVRPFGTWGEEARAAGPENRRRWGEAQVKAQSVQGWNGALRIRRGCNMWAEEAGRPRCGYSRGSGAEWELNNGERT